MISKLAQKDQSEINKFNSVSSSQQLQKQIYSNSTLIGQAADVSSSNQFDTTFDLRSQQDFLINRRVSGRFGTVYKSNQKYDPIKKIGLELEPKTMNFMANQST